MIVGGAEQMDMITDGNLEIGNFVDMKELKVIFNIGIQMRKTLIATGNLIHVMDTPLQ